MVDRLIKTENRYVSVFKLHQNQTFQNFQHHIHAKSNTKCNPEKCIEFPSVWILYIIKQLVPGNHPKCLIYIDLTGYDQRSHSRIRIFVHSLEITYLMISFKEKGGRLAVQFCYNFFKVVFFSRKKYQMDLGRKI